MALAQAPELGLTYMKPWEASFWSEKRRERAEAFAANQAHCDLMGQQFGLDENRGRSDCEPALNEVPLAAESLSPRRCDPA